MSIESAVKVVLSAPCIKDKANNVSEENNRTLGERI